MREVIGTYRVEEIETRRDRSYPTASWYQDVEIEPQTVEIFAEVRPDGKVEDTSVLVSLAGTVTASYFPSSFGGMSYGNGNRPEDIGNLRAYFVRPYAHALAKSILDGAEYARPWTLSDGFEAVEIPYSYEGAHGTVSGVTFGIRRVRKLPIPARAQDSSPVYCQCETPVIDVEHDSGCRRCGAPVNFNPRAADVAIEELEELGCRAYNIVKRMDVHTCEELLAVSAEDLNRWTLAGNPAPGLPAARQIAAAQDFIRANLA